MGDNWGGDAPAGANGWGANDDFAAGGSNDFDDGNDNFGDDAGGNQYQQPAQIDPTSFRPLADFEFDFATFGTKILDCNGDEAWNLMKLAANGSEPDLVMFKQAFVNYVYALYRGGEAINAAVMESTMRREKWGIYLVAISRPFVPAYTVVGLDGTPGLTHVLTFQTRPDAPNDKLATHWPKSPEENLELLKVSGLTVASNATVCRGCGGVGHTKKECAAMVEPPPRLLPSCVYCVETHPEQAQTHHARDCPHPRPQTRPPKKACKTCQSEEHLAADCPDRVIFTCRVCGSEDHKAAECPNKEVRTCHNCGSPDHISKECDAPRKERDLSGVTCYNCNETGHSRRECPHPFDYTKIRCRNCGADGHSAGRCLLPPKQVAPKVEEMVEEMEDMSMGQVERQAPTASVGDDGW